MKGSVKVMRLYDYCHFEVCLGSDEDMTLEQIDDMRKDAQWLADKAVEQYKTAKDVAKKRLNIIRRLVQLTVQVCRLLRR